MFVWVVLVRSAGGEPYVLGVFGSRTLADEQAWRWERHHRGGHADVQRFVVTNGRVH